MYSRRNGIAYIIIFTIISLYIHFYYFIFKQTWIEEFLEISKVIKFRHMARPYLYDYNCNSPLPSLLISFLHTNFHKISALIFSSVMMSFTLLLVLLLVNFRRLATFPLRRFRTSLRHSFEQENRGDDRILPSDVQIPL